MRHLLSLALAALVPLLAGACASNRQIAPGVTAVNPGDPIAPGAVRFTLTNPNNEKWVPRIREGAPDGSVRYGFTCKVLSCPEPATVVVTNRAAPPGRPDAKTLEQLARESIPKLAQARNLELQVATNNRAKLETLSTSVQRYQDYPAVLSETKLTAGDRTRFMAVALVFAGKLVVTINAEAADRQTAKVAVEDFGRVFKVEEGPPL